MSLELYENERPRSGISVKNVKRSKMGHESFLWSRKCE